MKLQENIFTNEDTTGLGLAVCPFQTQPNCRRGIQEQVCESYKLILRLPQKVKKKHFIFKLYIWFIPDHYTCTLQRIFNFKLNHVVIGEKVTSQSLPDILDLTEYLYSTLFNQEVFEEMVTHLSSSQSLVNQCSFPLAQSHSTFSITFHTSYVSTSL